MPRKRSIKANKNILRNVNLVLKIVKNYKVFVYGQKMSNVKNALIRVKNCLYLWQNF